MVNFSLSLKKKVLLFKVLILFRKCLFKVLLFQSVDFLNLVFFVGF